MTQHDTMDGRVDPANPYAVTEQDPWTAGTPVPPWAAAPWEVKPAPRRARRRGRAAWLAALAAATLLLVGLLGQRALQLAHRTTGTPAASGLPQVSGSIDGATTRTKPAVPPGTSSLALLQPVPVLDTRSGRPLRPGGEVSARLPRQAGDRPTAVALSVSVIDAAGTGAVTVGAAEQPQLRVPAGGATTTGLVVTGVGADRTVRFRTTSGGHLVADLVGTYAPVSAATAAGRTIVVAPQQVAHRVTAKAGHDGIVSATAPPAIPDTGVGAVLIRLTADVNKKGGILTLGPSPDRLRTTLRWSPPTSADNVRQALAFVPLDRSGRFAVSYHGGFVLDIHVLAYVTAPTAKSAVTGLFVPAEPGRPLSARVPGGGGTQVDLTGRLPVAADRMDAALVTVTAAAQRPASLTLGRPPARLPNLPGHGAAKVILAAVRTGPQLVVRSTVDTAVGVDVAGVLLAR
jgi:hypothetical protein